MFQCLEEHVAMPRFGNLCKGHISERQAHIRDIHQLEHIYKIGRQCQADIDKHCPVEKVSKFVDRLIHDYVTHGAKLWHTAHGAKLWHMHLIAWLL